MKTGQVLRVANDGKGQSGDRWSRRLLSMSIGAVRTHLVARAEHLHFKCFGSASSSSSLCVQGWSNLCTHCARSCSGKMAVFDMSFDLENR